jgi:hypothetical protein
VHNTEKRRDTNTCARQYSFIALDFGRKPDNNKENDRGRIDGEYNKYYRSNTNDMSPSIIIGRVWSNEVTSRRIRIPLDRDERERKIIKSY